MVETIDNGELANLNLRKSFTYFDVSHISL